jgi:hypothetical protein
MAITYGQPWIMTAAGDTEGRGAGGEYEFPIYIQQIKVDTGDGGDFLINAASGSGRKLKLDSTPANDTLWVPINATWERFYVETLPTNATIEIYHGHPDDGA